MPRKYKNREENPLHKEFGVWDNTRFILKKILQYCPVILPLALMGIVCRSVMGYYWGIFGKFVIDTIEQKKGFEADLHRLLLIILIGGIIMILLTVGNVLSNGLTWYRYIWVRTGMITERVARVLDMPYETLEDPDVLDVAERATQATGGNNNGVEGMMHQMENLSTELFTVIVTFIGVTILDFRLLLVLAVLAFVQFLYFRHIVKLDKEGVWDKLAPTWRQRHYMERVTQDFDYAKDIRLFHLGDFLSNKLRAVYAMRERIMDYHQDLWFRHGIFVQLVNIVAKSMVYGVLIYSVLHRGLSIGDFTMFLSLSMSFSGSLINFLHRMGDYKRASLETDDYRSFMELDLGISEEDTLPIPDTKDYEIEFHHVSYRYTGAEKDALSGMNLKLRPGEKLAVVGRNGAGKSTMIKLLLRLYDPTEGTITLNGTDIRRFKRSDYYQLFSPVFQDVEIFAFPLGENISMESPSKTDRERARQTALEAGLEEKLDSLERGLDTPLTTIVEEDGIDLSGGEKQKLALARALYKGASVVVLDEPTSALDALAEQQMYERFNDMIGEKSAVYISHRLASTRFCDHIAMFEDGKLLEYGTHEELLSKGGAYAEMFRTQAQYYQDEKKGGTAL